MEGFFQEKNIQEKVEVQKTMNYSEGRLPQEEADDCEAV
jgi:hypothetical protein